MINTFYLRSLWPLRHFCCVNPSTSLYWQGFRCLSKLKTTSIPLFESDSPRNISLDTIMTLSVSPLQYTLYYLILMMHASYCNKFDDQFTIWYINWSKEWWRCLFGKNSLIVAALHVHTHNQIRSHQHLISLYSLRSLLQRISIAGRALPMSSFYPIGTISFLSDQFPPRFSCQSSAATPHRGFVHSASQWEAKAPRATIRCAAPHIDEWRSSMLQGRGGLRTTLPNYAMREEKRDYRTAGIAFGDRWLSLWGWLSYRWWSLPTFLESNQSGFICRTNGVN